MFDGILRFRSLRQHGALGRNSIDVRAANGLARRAAGFVVVAALMASGSASAHFFVQPYTLPVPFWMYAWGSAAALIASFALVGWFATAPHVLVASAHDVVAKQPGFRIGRPALCFGRVMGVSLITLCIVSGLVGTQSVHDNINMTIFWICFVLCVPYVVAVVGDFYSVMNPWRAMVSLLERILGSRFLGQSPYPRGASFWPAAAVYLVFIWLELFAHLSPRGLSVAMAAYALLNAAGAWRFGTRNWFHYGEFFGVFCRLIGMMAPFAWERCDSGGVRLRLRWPFLGLLEEPAESFSLVVFALCMLATTAFDGLHETLPWVTVYWAGVLPHVSSWAELNPNGHWATALYKFWQWGALVVMPLMYLGVYTLFVYAMIAATRTNVGVRELMRDFAMSLMPIVFVYHLTHYYTLTFAQGPQIVRLASDPFGFGWDLFGTAREAIRPFMIEVNTIWHTQVALILAGHIASVYLAHVMALRVFRSNRSAVISQFPMLVLMVIFTAFGLWILSLPLASGT